MRESNSRKGVTHIRPGHTEDPTRDHRPVVDLWILAIPQQSLYSPNDGRRMSLNFRVFRFLFYGHETLDLDDAVSVPARQRVERAPRALTGSGGPWACVGHSPVAVFTVQEVFVHLRHHDWVHSSGGLNVTDVSFELKEVGELCTNEI